MSGFADNLRIARLASGQSIVELAARSSLALAAIDDMERPGAPLPELPILVRLADALGCRVDDLLAGDDHDFDPPERRHAALIAARMGRVRTLMTQVRVAHDRGELRPQDVIAIDEASLLDCVSRCRAWVMSQDHDLGLAAAIEAELDQHVERVRAAYERARQHADALAALQARAASRPARDTAGPRLVTPPTPQAPGAHAAVVGGAPSAPPPAPAPPRNGTGGHRSTLWEQEFADQQHSCVLVTGREGVSVELLVEDRVLESQSCATLDEAFQQSTTWRQTFLVPAILALPPMPTTGEPAAAQQPAATPPHRAA